MPVRLVENVEHFSRVVCAHVRLAAPAQRDWHAAELYVFRQLLVPWSEMRFEGLAVWTGIAEDLHDFDFAIAVGHVRTADALIVRAFLELLCVHCARHASASDCRGQGDDQELAEIRHDNYFVLI